LLLPVLPFVGQIGPDFRLHAITGFLLIDTLLVGNIAAFGSALAHLALPGAALGIAFSPAIMRVLRASLAQVWHQDYIVQARLRGIPERRLLLVHAARNAILPTLTLMGVQFGFLFGGTLLVEIIYSFPGIGNLMVDAVRNADLPVIEVVGLAYCVVVLAISMAVDALVLVLDPRLRTLR
ncbi:MAG: ABC transporter permease, partial [Acetobacteraceae bacterium]